MCVLGFLVICSRASFVVLNPPLLGTSSRSLYLNKPVFTCKRQLKSINMHGIHFLPFGSHNNNQDIRDGKYTKYIQ